MRNVFYVLIFSGLYKILIVPMHGFRAKLSVQHCFCFRQFRPPGIIICRCLTLQGYANSFRGKQAPRKDGMRTTREVYTHAASVGSFLFISAGRGWSPRARRKFDGGVARRLGPQSHRRDRISTRLDPSGACPSCLRWPQACCAGPVPMRFGPPNPIVPTRPAPAPSTLVNIRQGSHRVAQMACQAGAWRSISSAGSFRRLRDTGSGRLPKREGDRVLHWRRSFRRQRGGLADFGFRAKCLQAGKW